MELFGKFRRLTEAIQRVATCLVTISQRLGAILDKWDSEGGLLPRVEHLELTRAAWEAEIEGGVLKADSKLKAAANAEARERQLRKSNERLYGPRDEDGDEGEEGARDADQANDAVPGEEEGMLPVHQDVAVDPRATVIAAKYL